MSDQNILSEEDKKHQRQKNIVGALLFLFAMFSFLVAFFGRSNM